MAYSSNTGLLKCWTEVYRRAFEASGAMSRKKSQSERQEELAMDKRKLNARQKAIAEAALKGMPTKCGADAMADCLKPWKLHKQKRGPGVRFTDYIPGHAENLTYHQNHKRGRKPSVFDPSQEVDDPTNSYTICPRCKSEGPELDHADLAQCGECGLTMQLFGNRLSVWVGDWPVQAKQKT